MHEVMITNKFFLIFLAAFAIFVGSIKKDREPVAHLAIPPVLIFSTLTVFQIFVPDIIPRYSLGITGLIVGIPCIIFSATLFLAENYHNNIWVSSIRTIWYKEIDNINYRVHSSDYMINLAGFSLTTFSLLLVLSSGDQLMALREPISLVLSSAIILLASAQIVRGASFIGPLFVGQILYLVGCLVLVAALIWIFLEFGLAGSVLLNVSTLIFSLAISYHLYRNTRTFINRVRVEMSHKR